jgi:hypothetical protein
LKSLLTRKIGPAGISEDSAGKTAMFFAVVVGAIKPTESGAKSTAQVGISYPTALKTVTLIRLSMGDLIPENCATHNESFVAKFEGGGRPG